MRFADVRSCDQVLSKADPRVSPLAGLPDFPELPGTLRTVTGLPEGFRDRGRSADGLLDERGVSEPNSLHRSLDQRVPGEKLVYFAGL